MIELELTYNQIAIIDDIDHDLANYKWLYHKGGGRDKHRGYVTRSTGRRGSIEHISLHVVILSRKLGRPLQEGELGDHWDGNTLNNTRDNIRLATHSQNSQNRKGVVSKTGYKGIYFNTRSGRWGARVFTKRKGKNLGYYDTPEQAARVYDQAARELYGEFAVLNFPSDDIQISARKLDYPCPYCEAAFSSIKGVSGHSRFCPAKQGLPQ